MNPELYESGDLAPNMQPTRVTNSLLSSEPMNASSGRHIAPAIMSSGRYGSWPHHHVPLQPTMNLDSHRFATITSLRASSVYSWDNITISPPTNEYTSASQAQAAMQRPQSHSNDQHQTSLIHEPAPESTNSSAVAPLKQNLSFGHDWLRQVRALPTQANTVEHTPPARTSSPMATQSNTTPPAVQKDPPTYFWTKRNPLSPPSQPGGPKRQHSDISYQKAAALKRQALTRPVAQPDYSQQSPYIEIQPRITSQANISAGVLWNPQEYHTYHSNLFEQQRLAEANRIEQERRIKRKEELKQDESALYRHYEEYLEYFPVQFGEHRSQYLSRLLANQRVPMDEESDLCIAIKYAKKNWQIYLEYPRDLAKAVAEAKAKIEEEKNDWMGDDSGTMEQTPLIRREFD